MRLINIIVVTSFMAFLGCSSKDYMSGWVHFPAGTNFQSGRYHLGITVYGAKRHAYVDRTKKRVYLVIEKSDEEIFKREYEVIAGELEWDVTWDRLDDLQILFFQYRERVSSLSENIFESTPKGIFSVRFTHNKDTGRFVEYPAPEKIKKRVNNDLSP